MCYPVGSQLWKIGFALGCNFHSSLPACSLYIRKNYWVVTGAIVLGVFVVLWGLGGRACTQLMLGASDNDGGGFIWCWGNMHARPAPYSEIVSGPWSQFILVSSFQ